mmetsp:Transcript_60890/g.145121  ORF Transcript_60890/g.145121 Transcript_60890/m.145121 type:complete len:377 (+) Transcript_60890:104-1234(+)|eukprot:CAMPEP_0178428268 /NCGR_PEP_ID=MMETSP0689_2-20121128/30188_1 /TAXON_ID=160604 /ORGANISM="Amphidinium massartii, Strain CS-259" /LENGTH=376 /DNA_ID=CAMNT_0020050031 /DNA_START=39 /DNA_END=1166 /DNA_ORIENTATION=-
MGNEASQPGMYVEPKLEPDVTEVRLSVYTLKFTEVTLLDSMGANFIGAYHSGVVFHGSEWAYGGHDEEGLSGVYSCRPEENPEFRFYRRIVLGRVRAPREALRGVIGMLENDRHWEGNRYDLVEHNCNHFASALCWKLLRRTPPSWVNKTAEGLAEGRRKRRALEAALKKAMMRHFGKECTMPAQTNNSQSVASSELAYRSAFERTFSEAWDAGVPHLALPSEHRADMLDTASLETPVNLQWNNEQEPCIARWRAEEKLHVAAGHAAAKAAQKAALCFDLGAPSYQRLVGEKVSEAGLAKWDVVWRRESRELLGRWRQAAITEALAPLQCASGADIAVARPGTSMEEEDYITMITDALARAELAAKTVDNPSVANY